MKQQSGQPNDQFPIQRIWPFALMTIVGPATFAVAFSSTEPNWVLWFFGGLMLLCMISFWSSYALYRWRRR